MAYLESLQCPIDAFGEIANSGNVAPARNLMFNGNFDFWQRGTSFLSLTNNTTYGADRWRAFRNTSAADFSMLQTSITAGDVPGAQFGLRMQRVDTTSATNAYGVVQMLPNLDTLPALGQYLTVSFWARRGALYSATSNLLSVGISYGTGTNEKGSGVAFTGATNAGSGNVTLGTSWARYTLTITTQIPAATATQIEINFTSIPTGTAGATDYFDIARVCVAPGRFPVPFNYRCGDYEAELGACERFFEKSFALTTTPATGVSANRRNFNQVKAASSSQDIGFLWRVMKRRTPSVTLYNSVSANALIRNAATGTDFSTTSVIINGTIGCALSGTSPGGSNAGDLCDIHYTADAEL